MEVAAATVACAAVFDRTSDSAVGGPPGAGVGVGVGTTCTTDLVRVRRLRGSTGAAVVLLGARPRTNVTERDWLCGAPVGVALRGGNVVPMGGAFVAARSAVIVALGVRCDTV